MQIQSYWNNLSAAHKRVASIVLSISALLILVAVVKNTGGERTSVKDRALDKTKKVALVDTNTRSLGIDAINAQLNTIHKEIGKVSEQQLRAEERLKDIEKRRGNDPDVTKSLDQVRGQVAALNNAAKQLGWEVDDIKNGQFPTSDSEGQVDAVEPEDSTVQRKNVKSKPPVDTTATPTEKPDARDANDPNYFFRSAPVRPVGPEDNGSANAPTVDKAQLKIVSIEAPQQKENHDGVDNSIYLPTGTMISGVTINGLLAPTGMNSKKDPFPIVVRIQHEAIMPNGFRADITECMATFSGYGDLSSERVMLRGEKISCLTKNKQYIDVSLPGFVNGEDGLAGLRGVLVTRSGSLVARSALAGFGAGLGEAFDTTQVPTLQTGSTVPTKPTYQENFSQGAMQHGFAKGMSSSMERISEYYMELADQMFPVIEIEAGRQVDIFLVSGLRLTKKDLAIREAPKKSNKE